VYDRGLFHRNTVPLIKAVTIEGHLLATYLQIIHDFEIVGVSILEHGTILE